MDKAEAPERIHWMFVLRASATACGIERGNPAMQDPPTTRLEDYVTCPDCKLVLVGYKFGRTLAATPPSVAEGGELKPCPWCTVPPEVCKAAGYGMTVECVNELCPVGPSTNVVRGRKNAITTWNTRTPAPVAQSPTLAEIILRIGDPGAFTPRGDNYSEPITSWSARAVLMLLNERRATPVATSEARVCVKCGHDVNDARRRGSDGLDSFCIYGCGCECVFPEPSEARVSPSADAEMIARKLANEIDTHYCSAGPEHSSMRVTVFNIARRIVAAALRSKGKCPADEATKETTEAVLDSMTTCPECGYTFGIALLRGKGKA